MSKVTPESSRVVQMPMTSAEALEVYRKMMAEISSSQGGITEENVFRLIAATALVSIDSSLSFIADALERLTYDK